MNNLNKYDLIREAIMHANELVDARGVDKCVLVINLVQKLNTVEGLLHDEDANNEAAIRDLSKKIDALSAPTEVTSDADTDSE